MSENRASTLAPHPLSWLSRLVLVLPLALTLGIGALSVGAWHLIRSDAEIRLQNEMNGHATHAAARIEAHIETRLAIGLHLAEDLRDKDIESNETLAACTNPTLEMFPDIQAINWMDRQGVIRLVSPLAGNAAAIGLDVRTLGVPGATLAAAEKAGSYRITPPITLAQGGRGFVAYVPIADGPGGFLNIVFRTQPLVEAAFPPELVGRYAAAISDAGVPVFGDGSAPAARTAPREIRVGNRVWTLTLAPLPPTLQRHAAHTDELVLAAGLVLALALGWLLRIAMVRRQVLKESEARFRDIATLTSDWFWEADKDLRFTYVSDRFTPATGLSADDYLGHRREDQLDLEQRGSREWLDHLADMEAHRPFRDFEYAVHRPGQGTIHFRTSGVPVFDDAGRFSGYRGSATNITEEKSTAAALRGAEDKLRDILDNTPVAIAIVDHPDNRSDGLPGRRRFVNRAMVNLFGAGVGDQLLTGDIADTWADLEQMKSLEASFRRGENLRGYECLRRRLDGSTFWASMSSLPIVFEGENCTMLWIFDIDDRKRMELALQESEAQLRAVFDNTPVCINLKDTEGRFLWLNKPYEQWYGRRASEIVGKTLFELGLKQDQVETVDIIEKQALEKGQTVESELHITRSDGSEFDRIIIKFPIKSTDGEVYGVGTVALDISERKRMESDLWQAKMDAEAANRAKSEFLAHMSHDLRTPLNAILGFSEIMKHGTFGPLGDTRYEEYIQLIHDSGQQLVGMVNDVLDLSRIESGEYELTETSLDVYTAMVASRRRCQHWVPDGSRATIRIAAERDRPRLLADETALSQILDNFVTNAIKYAGPDPTITMHWDVADDGHGLLRVGDTGPGIPADELKRILQPFVRGSNASGLTSQVSKKIEGVGLGLHIVARLAEMHGATFTLESAAGQGTTATVIFPPERVEAS